MHDKKTVKHRYSDALTQVSWQQFERLLATYYAGQGYRVEHAGTGGSGTQFDGGIDLKLYRDNQYLVVQCKHWNVMQVTHNPVHELLGVMLTQRADGAIVITSGEFTNAARVAAAKDTRVTLIDGAALREMLGPIAGIFAPSVADQAGSADAGRFDRGSPRGHRRASRSGRSTSRNPLPGIVVTVVIGLVGYASIQHTLHGLAAKRVSPAPLLASPPGYSSTSRLSAPTVISAVASVLPSQKPKVQITHMSPAEQLKWQRKNNEAMKILEATTPPLAR